MQLICILCPRGCHIQIQQVKDGEWKIEGHGCKRGKDYAIQEATCPLRVLTTSVWVEGGIRLVSAKTDRSIPRIRLLSLLNRPKINCKAPINIGDILVKNIAGTGANLVATRKIDRE